MSVFDAILGLRKAEHRALVARLGPDSDTVPIGYWDRLGKAYDAMPALPDDDGDDAEPFV